MNKVAAFALRRKNSILSMSEKMFCPPQPLRFWITPAYAGKSRFPSSTAPYRRDHPRVCGEKSRVCRPRMPSRGSPPRMRGKVVQTAGDVLCHGITPACAGKRLRAQSGCKTLGDHPRVCGEKPAAAHHSTLTRGSPPRVRGKAPMGPNNPLDVRITPACAGKR